MLGACLRKLSRPSTPSDAIWTCKPSASKSRRKVRCIGRLSSTTRTVSIHSCSCGRRTAASCEVLAGNTDQRPHRHLRLGTFDRSAFPRTASTRRAFCLPRKFSEELGDAPPRQDSHLELQATVRCLEAESSPRGDPTK